MTTRKVVRKSITDHADLLEQTPEHNRAPLGEDFASAGSAVNVSATISNRLRWMGRWALRQARQASSRMRRGVHAEQELVNAVQHRLADPDLIKAEGRAATERALTTTPKPLAGPHHHARLGLVLALTVLVLRWLIVLGMATFDAMYLFSYFLNVFEGPENPTLADVANPKVLSAIMVSVLPTAIVLLMSETAGAVLAHRIDKSSRAHARKLLPWLDGIFAVLALLLVTWFLHEVAASRFQSTAAFAGAQRGAEATIGFLTLLPWLMVLISTIVHTPRFQESLANARHQRALARFERTSLRRGERLSRLFMRAEQRFQRWAAKFQASFDRVGQIADSQVVRAALGGAYGPTAPQWTGNRDLAGAPEERAANPGADDGHAARPFTVTGAPATLVATVERYVHPEVRQVLAEAHQSRTARQALPDLALLFATFRREASRKVGVLDDPDEAVEAGAPTVTATVIDPQQGIARAFTIDADTDPDADDLAA